MEYGVYCEDCEEPFDVIYNNKPWLDVEFCPLCGSDNIIPNIDADDD